VEGIFREKLNAYKYLLSENEEFLKDKRLGYHEYFAIVYKIEQQRILHEQINMIQYAQ
jgi:hypothetical protein